MVNIRDRSHFIRVFYLCDDSATRSDLIQYVYRAIDTHREQTSSIRASSNSTE